MKIIFCYKYHYSCFDRKHKKTSVYANGLPCDAYDQAPKSFGETGAPTSIHNSMWITSLKNNETPTVKEYPPASTLHWFLCSFLHPQIHPNSSDTSVLYVLWWQACNIYFHIRKQISWLNTKLGFRNLNIFHITGIIRGRCCLPYASTFIVFDTWKVWTHLNLRSQWVSCFEMGKELTWWCELK